MEIKPNLVNNNIRLNSYETNTQGNIHVIPRREFLHHRSVDFVCALAVCSDEDCGTCGLLTQSVRYRV